MNEKPIIFSGTSVSAINDGRKSQTRRVVKDPDSYGCLTGDCPHEAQAECDAAMIALSSYKAGDLLWVREMHQAGRDTVGRLVGVAIRDEHPTQTAPGFPSGAGGDWALGWKKASPIYMPKWATRLWLEITSVRVERLQEISPSDCVAEGIPASMDGHGGTTWDEAQDDFRELWDSINGKRAPWSDNPWVFVVSFHRIDRTQRCEQHGRHLVIERELDPYCVWCWNEQDPPEIGRGVSG